ncbi:facilitated trehalose transporter Tret1, partial [Xylocopa sonorina]|uniref:facilitated trehalose transporter Tret1 n=1 Tax=Xylocopa sonorina TaxID=1818115 RepID=UPI00403AF081
NKQEKCNVYLQLISSTIVNLSLFSAGLCYGWVTVSLPILKGSKSDVPLTGDQGGWIASGLPIGACFGPVMSALLLDNIGRKWSLYLTNIPFIVSWVLTYLAQSWLLLFVGKFVAGISVGAAISIAPIYLGELVEKRIRGASSAMIALFLNLGQIAMYAIGPLVDRKMLALIGLAPSIVILLTAVWIPESPYYYLKKNRETSAELSLIWLRRKRDNQDEMNQMKQLIEAEKGGGIKDVFKKMHRKPLLILLLLLSGQQLCGYLGVQSYSIQLFANMRLSFSENTALLIMSGVSLVLSILAAFIVDKLGRKPVFLIASYGSSLCLFVIGGFLLVKKLGIKVDNLYYVPFAATLLYIAFFSFGLAQIPAIISSEIFPLNVKSYATMIANIFGSVLGLIVVKCYQLLADAVGVYSVLLAFGVIEFVIAIAASIVMPETSRKSFAEIQQILNPNLPITLSTDNLTHNEIPKDEESET